MSAAEVSISDHARAQAARRGIEQGTLRRVAEGPEQVVPVREGREVRQSRVRFPAESKVYLVRLIVDSGPSGPVVVTAFRTSKVEKYWRKG